MPVRFARLDDTQAIVTLFCARIPTWQRLDANGRVQDVPYNELSLYERWQHGGAWMSPETGAIFLNHLLLGAGIPLVYVHETGRITGYAEGYLSLEGEPFGANLHLAHLLADEDTARAELLAAVRDQAAQSRLERITITQPGDVELPTMETPTMLASISRYSLSPKEGQVFFQVTELPSPHAGQIARWSMTSGRATSARHQWETTMPTLFETIPQIASQRHARLKVTAGGQEALVYMSARLYDDRAADFLIWTPRLLQPQTVAALRDWAGREGYRTLWFTVASSAVQALGPDAEADGFTLHTLTLPLTPQSAPSDDLSPAEDAS
jgi:hypothetical protein